MRRLNRHLRTNIAIVLCLGAVIVEALLAWHTHQITYADVNMVACVWLMTGLWLGGRLGAILHRSPKGVFQEFRKREPMPGLSKLIFNGGLLLELASLALLFR
jgi:hypothetical protein